MVENPFTIAYNTMWKLVDDNPMWDSLVKEKCRIKFNSDTNRDPSKNDQKSSSDYPELMLIPAAGKANTHETSCAVKVVVKYTWSLSTGDLRSNAIFEQCQWAMLCSYVNFVPAMQALRWQGEQFVKRIDAQAWQVGTQDPKAHSNIRGWAALWSTELEFWLPRTQLIGLSTRQSCEGT